VTAAAAAAARIAASSGGTPTPPGSAMSDQALNEYIRVPDKMVGLSKYWRAHCYFKCDRKNVNTFVSDIHILLKKIKYTKKV
jgi:hypothetical protein